jgi:hypothetical protein
MALERKPVEGPQDPGYPDADEYASSRRAFLWLLGAAAAATAGIAAECALTSQTPPRRTTLPPAPPRPRAVPQSSTLGW